MMWKKGYLFGFFKKLKKGDRFYIFLTFKCTLQCSYCTNRAYNGEIPSCSIIRLDEWKKVINNHPKKIREVVITGGEPTLHPDFSKLVDWLISKGYYVTIFSNLGTLHGCTMKQSRRIHIVSTYHKTANQFDFSKNLALYKKKYRVSVHVLGVGDNVILPCALHSKIKTPCKYASPKCCLMLREAYHYMPNGVRYRNMLKALEDMHKQEGTKCEHSYNP